MVRRDRRGIRLQKFVSVHAPVFNHCNQEPAPCSGDNFKANRTAALAEVHGLFAA